MREDNVPRSDTAQPRGGAADLSVMLAAHRAFRRDVTTLARVASRDMLRDPVRRATFPPALAQRYRGEWKPWYDAISRW